VKTGGQFRAMKKRQEENSLGIRRRGKSWSRGVDPQEHVEKREEDRAWVVEGEGKMQEEWGARSQVKARR